MPSSSEISFFYFSFRSKWHYIGAPFAPSIVPSPAMFVVSCSNKLLVSAGHWDNSFRVESLEKGKIIARVAYHQGAWYWLYVFMEWRGGDGGMLLSQLLAFSLSWCACLLHILVLLHHLLLCVAVVTCMALDVSGCHLITGSRNLTCAIWGSARTPKLLSTLYRHCTDMMMRCGHNA